jgi:hypothetical protein
VLNILMKAGRRLEAQNRPLTKERACVQLENQVATPLFRLEEQWMYKRLFLLQVILSLCVVSLAYASLEEAISAYDQGDYSKALREFKGLADQGNAKAQLHLAAMYDIGQGVQQNQAEAMKWYIKAAEQGLDRAEFALGMKYAGGMGISQDYTQAIKWYTRAAEHGLPEAQSDLGLLYSQGKGVPQNKAEAVEWYRKAAEQGYAMAQCNLGLMYVKGEGVSQDYAEAVKWFQRAAAQEYVKAQYNLGVAYQRGDGIPKDLKLAYMWFSLAATRGDSDAKSQMETLAPQMTPSQIAEAQGMTGNWKPKEKDGQEILLDLSKPPQ